MSVTIIGDGFIDIILPIQGIKSGETHHREIFTSNGGVANVAVQIAKLGENVKFIGKVGNDILGRQFKGNLGYVGVKDLTFIDEKYATGICASLICNGERTMIARRGANDYLTMNEILGCIDEIQNSKIVYFSGYSLLSKKTSASVLYAIETAKNNKCKIYFNPGAQNIISPTFKEIIRDFVDVLILNLDEAKAFTKKTDINKILCVLSDFAKLVVVTLGMNGCVLCINGNLQYVQTTTSKVEDTTGAGDAFSAGFIVGRLRGMDYIECAKFGNESATMFLHKKMEFTI